MVHRVLNAIQLHWCVTGIMTYDTYLLVLIGCDALSWRRMTNERLPYPALNLLSPSLREEVAMQLNAEWMEKVPFFKCCPSMMLIRLSFVLKNESYPPDETFILADQPATKLCLIKKGIAVSKVGPPAWRAYVTVHVALFNVRTVCSNQSINHGCSLARHWLVADYMYIPRGGVTRVDLTCRLDCSCGFGRLHFSVASTALC